MQIRNMKMPISRRPVTADRSGRFRSNLSQCTSAAAAAGGGGPEKRSTFTGCTVALLICVASAARLV